MARRLTLALTIVALCAAISAAVAMGGGKSHRTRDNRVRDGIHAIQIGIQKYAADNNDVYPAAFMVWQGGAVGRYVDKWPVNPWTGLPMSSGITKGNYTYTQLAYSTGYSLTGDLSRGDFTVP